jgi:hypothetical protein
MRVCDPVGSELDGEFCVNGTSSTVDNEDYKRRLLKFVDLVNLLIQCKRVTFDDYIITPSIPLRRARAVGLYT